MQSEERRVQMMGVKLGAWQCVAMSDRRCRIGELDVQLFREERRGSRLLGPISGGLYPERIRVLPSVRSLGSVTGRRGILGSQTRVLDVGVLLLLLRWVCFGRAMRMVLWRLMSTIRSRKRWGS